ncbi:hypothetical protein FGG08_004178 [Glutinoglossum americanum]|uniref:MRH domain-containing protein n=1 Tax=Glutinoglossum americanum TaxID=1670608 RepID=A0A9P8KZU6_9PEZI|nr:hypothetical protein FGG08_004178 [Glutinoglossum americanum]
MRFLSITNTLLLAFALSARPTVSVPEDKKPKVNPPCTVHSPNSGSFFDLNPISIRPPKPSNKQIRDSHAESWLAKGYDYPVNFTINFCAPVVEHLKEVEGLDKAQWANVSAFYKDKGKIYSIGQLSTTPVFRGRKLVLNYTNGSPCAPHASSSFERRKKNKDHSEKKPHKDEDNNSDGEDKSSKKEPVTRRKSTLISLLCDRDPLAPKASVAFIGASPDECAYFFEARSSAACGGASDSEQTLGPGGVFGIIALTACLVYLIGGCVYQRTVMHARGWRQLPNYSMWAGIGSFIRDIFIILLSSCTRFLPRRNGYRNLPTSIGGSGRRRSADAENRLIDQYDEEWED